MAIHNKKILRYTSFFELATEAGQTLNTKHIISLPYFSFLDGLNIVLFDHWYCHYSSKPMPNVIKLLLSLKLSCS